MDPEGTPTQKLARLREKLQELPADSSSDMMIQERASVEGLIREERARARVYEEFDRRLEELTLMQLPTNGDGLCLWRAYLLSARSRGWRVDFTIERLIQGTIQVLRNAAKRKGIDADHCRELADHLAADPHNYLYQTEITVAALAIATNSIVSVMKEGGALPLPRFVPNEQRAFLGLPLLDIAPVGEVTFTSRESAPPRHFNGTAFRSKRPCVICCSQPHLHFASIGMCRRRRR